MTKNSNGYVDRDIQTDRKGTCENHGANIASGADCCKEPSKPVNMSPVELLRSDFSPIKDAVQTLITEIRNDSYFYYAYQANIAMAFQDAFWNYISQSVPAGEKVPVYSPSLSRDNIHYIANEAAKNFLDLWTKPDPLNPQEALMGFIGFITSHDKTVVTGRQHNVYDIMNLATEYINAQNLEPVTSNFPKNLRPTHAK